MRTLTVVAAISLLGVRAEAQCTAPVQKLINERKLDEARAEAQAALKKNASDDAALECMGRAAVADGKPGDAIDWFEKAIRANEKSPMHHLMLADALGAQAEHTNKLKLPFLARRLKGELDRALELDPTSIDARHGLIQFYSQAPGVMGGSMDKAKEQAREITKLNPARGHLEMAALLDRDKDPGGAEKEFAAAITASPDSTFVYNGLGNFYRRQKRYDDAITVWERLVKAKPDAMGAHLQIGYNLALAGHDLDRAEREVRLWLSAPPQGTGAPNLSFAHYLLGDIYQRRTKTNEARAEFQLALQINPRNGEAKKALDALR